MYAKTITKSLSRSWCLKITEKSLNFWPWQPCHVLTHGNFWPNLPWPKIAMAKNCHSADRVPNPFNSLFSATFFQTLTQPSHQISPHCTKNPLICYITKRKKLKVQCHIPQINSRKIWKINFSCVSAKFKSLESKKMLCNAFYLSCQISKQKLCWIGYVLEDTF